MVSSPCKCSGTVGKVCSQFLPAKDKDPHLLSMNCRSKECIVDDCCGDCHNWSDEMWQKVSECHSRLVAQRQKRKAKASSSFSGIFFQYLYHYPYCLALLIMWLYILLFQLLLFVM